MFNPTNTVCNLICFAFISCKSSNEPSLSIVSLILLAAFSLNNPGCLLLMENNVMTPKINTEKRRKMIPSFLKKLMFTFFPSSHPGLGSSHRPPEPPRSVPEQTQLCTCSFCSRRNIFHSQNLHPPVRKKNKVKNVTIFLGERIHQNSNFTLFFGAWRLSKTYKHR